jgi:hypothetical protein
MSSSVPTAFDEDFFDDPERFIDPRDIAETDFAESEIAESGLAQTTPRARMEVVLDDLLNDVVTDQFDANRRVARRAARIVEAVELARAHPYVYTDEPSALAAEYAEGAVLFDLSLRLAQSETALQDAARICRDARRYLPALWRRAEEGFIAMALVDAALTGVYRLRPGAPSGDAEQDAAEVAIATTAVAELDARTSEWAPAVTPGGFRSRLSRLLGRLDARSPEARHAHAMADRAVIRRSLPDGMAELNVTGSAEGIAAVWGRLTATAKHVAKDKGDTRTRDQIRSDLAISWLSGEGTPTAVKTKVYVTVPVGVLAGRATDELGRCTACGGTGRPESARIVGGDDLDALTAIQLFHDATAFHRVIVDPVRSVVVDMDRRTYRPTQAQRDWLILQHGTCARDACTRLAMQCDIDHDREWARGGPTNLDNERPLCPRDHVIRHRTRFRYRTRPNRSVEVVTPTGHTTDEPPPF